MKNLIEKLLKVIANLPDLDEWYNEKTLKKFGFKSWKEFTKDP